MAPDFTHPEPADRDAEDPPFVVHEIALVAGRIVRRRTRSIPRPVLGPDDDTPADDGPRRLGPRDKVHPRLRQMMVEKSDSAREQLIIVFADQPTIPRFPKPVLDEPPDSPRNLAERARSEALVRSIREQRAARYAELAAELAIINPGIEIIDRFWLLNGMLVDAPVSAVEPIAEADFVLSVEPRFSGEEPPADDQIDRGRERIGSDPYFDLGLPAPWIALLDTGVRSSHRLLASHNSLPSHLHRLRDCVNGGADCNTGPAVELGDVFGHGTAAAAILTGNTALGGDFRGVTAAPLDSFRVFHPSGGLDQDAARRAFELAVEMGNKVIVAEIAGVYDDLSLLSIAADSAYDGGAVVVAANGNTPGKNTVRAPANAHHVIGVGAFEVTSFGQYCGQSCGPTDDDRIKPDIQAPTDTVSARHTSDSATGQFSGTSGSTPYVGGAAALLRDETVGSDPGLVYAQLILFGSRVSKSTRTWQLIDSVVGAGHLGLIRDGDWQRGNIQVGNHEIATIPLDLPVAARKIHVAMWWPEDGPSDIHNTITLAVVDPSGNLRAEGNTAHSVFERCSVTDGVTVGTWSVIIRGLDVVSAPQTVYWGAFVEPQVIRLILRRMRSGLTRGATWLRYRVGRGTEQFRR